MTLPFPTRRALLALTAFLAVWGAGPAGADFRAPYFDKNARAEITFDANALKWTLYNKAVTRVLYFDRATGGLRTTLLRDIKRKRDFTPAPNSEGVFTFAPALKEAPTPLTGWKAINSAPGADWAKPGFDDAKWQAVALPAAPGGGTRWFRVALPNGRFLPDRSYSLLVYAAPGTSLEVFADGAALASGSGERPRVYHVDLPANARVVGVKTEGAGGLTQAALAEVGSAPAPVDLSGDWKYMSQAVTTGKDGSKILSISLSGVGSHRDLEVDVHYQIFPGEEPTLAKWFGFLSHRQTRYLLEEVTYDRWLPLSGAGEATGDWRCKTLYVPATRAGLMVGVLSPQGAAEAGGAAGLATVLRPYSLVKPDSRLLLAQALVAPFEGGPQTGTFLYQLHVGQYVARATEASVPDRYSTAFFGDTISASLCEKLIPETSRLGIPLFVMGEGWQAADKYGDWNADRARFPMGMLPVSALARAERLRFGFSVSPLSAAPGSSAGTNHPDWRTRPLAGAQDGPMCFTGGWGSDFTQAMLLLSRELGATCLHLSRSPLAPGCIATDHEHPVAHAQTAQLDTWNVLGERLRGLTQEFLLTAPVENGPALLRGNDISEDAALASTPAPGSAVAAYALSDQLRDSQRTEGGLLPPFLQSGVAYVHMPGGDLNALEYHLASAFALTGSVELRGDLTAMTLEERQTLTKWLNWHARNRALLAYGQPLAIADAPGVDGFARLRPALNGRYGFVCLWNRGDVPQRANLSVAPDDWFVTPGRNLQWVRMKDGSSAAAKIEEGKMALSINLPAHAWEIFELRAAP